VRMLSRSLGEICDEAGGTIRTGPFGSQLHESDYVTEGVPVVMPKDIVGGRVSMASIARISESDADRLSQHTLYPGDIVYGRRGDIGREALITDRESGWLCGTGCLRISPGDTVVNPLFLHYYLQQSSVIAWVTNQAIGATLPNLNTSILRSVPITYPEIHIQRKIALIISAYDDLIENNTRRIAILEEMARALYREWFVRFRFPGHEGAPLVESEIGPIPEGWEVVSLADIADVNARSIRADKAPAEITYVDIASVSTGQIDKMEHLRFTAAPGRARRVVQHGDIIWSTVRPNRRSYSLIINPPAELIVSTGFAVIGAVRVPYTYLYYLITTDDFVGYLTNHATGAAYPAVTGKDFEVSRTLLPPRSLLDRFHELAEPIVIQTQNLRTRNANLAQTRDLLLPKLISGEVDVSALEIGRELAAV
jgi:type I restriction enzyme S subunit